VRPLQTQPPDPGGNSMALKSMSIEKLVKLKD
jgi:hypothetical protein